MTNKDTMPKEIWVLENSAYGDTWYEGDKINNDDTKYTRLSPDEFIVNRKELEGMRVRVYSTDPEEITLANRCYNTAIDKILDMGE